MCSPNLTFIYNKHIMAIITINVHTDIVTRYCANILQVTQPYEEEKRETLS